MAGCICTLYSHSLLALSVAVAVAVRIAVAVMDPSLFVDTQEMEKFQELAACSICLEVWWKPVLIKKCGHIFCERCIHNWCYDTTKLPHVPKPNATCPDCREPLNPPNAWYKCPRSRLTKGLGASKLHCCNRIADCQVVSSYNGFPMHHEICPKREQRTAMIYDTITRRDNKLVTDNPMGQLVTSRRRRKKEARDIYEKLPLGNRE